MATEECACCKTWLAGGRMGSTNSLCQVHVVRANPSITTPVTGVCADKPVCKTDPPLAPNWSLLSGLVLARSRRCSK